MHASSDIGLDYLVLSFFFVFPPDLFVVFFLYGEDVELVVGWKDKPMKDTIRGGEHESNNYNTKTKTVFPSDVRPPCEALVVSTYL